MIEITNLTTGPIQLIVRTGTEARLPRNMTVLNVPGIGSGKNVVKLEDERYTDYIQRIEDAGHIKIKRITKSSNKKGE